MRLFPYQEAALEGVRAAFGSGSKAPILISPTGAGKTVMGAHIVKSHVSRPGTRAVWLAHRRELLTQARSTLRAVGVSDDKCVISSVQTLTSRGEAPEATLVVFDECHHFAAEDWGRLGTVYGNVPRVGLTATPERGDGLGLGDIFDSIVQSATVPQLVELGRLVPVVVHRPKRFLGKGQLALDPVEAYKRFTPRGQAVVFCPNIPSCNEFKATFAAAGIPAAVVTGETPASTRDDYLFRFANRELRVLLNVNVLTEGWDCPIADVCIFARRVGTPGLAIQCWGRVMRAAPGKSIAHVIDLTGVTLIHGGPGQDREYSLEGDGIRLVNKGDPAPSFCKVCGTPKTGPQCEYCGTETETIIPKGINEELEKIDWKQILKLDPPEKMSSRLSKWVGEARARGHKPQSALYKFKACYGRWPTRAEKGAAGL